jgi:LmbE family N-acetylglucosaminyl deacetylase
MEERRTTSSGRQRQSIKPRLLLVYAHPDDESFGSGGTIALAARRGFQIELICATSGEKGTASGEGESITQGELGKIRERELRNAAQILGIERVFFLRYRDGSLATMSHTKGIAAVRRIMGAFRPNIVITFSPRDGITGHRDHRTIGAWATESFQELHHARKLPPDARLFWLAIPAERFTIPSHMLMDPSVPRGTPLSEISTVVDCRSVRSKKRRAILSHVSQTRFLDSASAGITLSQEYFRRIIPPWRPQEGKEQWIWYDERKRKRL